MPCTSRLPPHSLWPPCAHEVCHSINETFLKQCSRHDIEVCVVYQSVRRITAAQIRKMHRVHASLSATAWRAKSGHFFHMPEGVQAASESLPPPL